MNINRKIMMSGLSIVSALTLLGGTAFAAFTTTATATGNTFSTSNPDLRIQTSGGFSSSEVGFTESGLVPGGTPVVHNFNLWNTNTGVDETMAATGQIVPTAGDASLESSLNVRVTCNNGTDTGYVVMSTWMSTPPSLGLIAPNAVVNCTMQVALPSGNTTDANKSITFDSVFGGTVGN